MFSRREGRRFSPRSASGVSELAQLETYLARNLFSWMRADYRTLVDYGGGDVRVSAFPDKVALVSEGAVAPNARSVDPAHAFAQGTQANQVASPSAVSELGGMLAAPFRGGQRYPSTIPPINWRFCHDGAGMSVWAIVVTRSTAGTRVICGTTNSGTVPGFHSYLSGQSLNHVVYRNVAGPVYNVVNVKTGVALGTALLSEQRHASADSPDYSSRYDADSAITGNYANAPAAGVDPAGAFQLGDNPPAQGLFLNDDLAEVLIANNTDAAVRSAVRRYAALRYAKAW